MFPRVRLKSLREDVSGLAQGRGELNLDVTLREALMEEGQIDLVRPTGMPHRRVATCLNGSRGRFVVLTKDQLYVAAQQHLPKGDCW